ncbi:MAG: 2-amino-4-hydroxy-6-hydroxymethyldihydropteridine diphosphokinase [Syntrophales bacterium]
MELPWQAGGEIRGVVAFIGIGSNQGNPADACREGVRNLSEIPGVRLLRCSSLYRTEPVGPHEQPWFINAVAEIRTALSPRLLFYALKGIERRMGRTEGPKWGPRIIDLDLLLYGQEVVQERDLVIPHPELHRRRFVLVPLCELASYAIHPAFGVSAGGLLERLEDPCRVERNNPAVAEGGYKNGISEM